jgi:hypothetical protein
MRPPSAEQSPPPRRSRQGPRVPLLGDRLSDRVALQADPRVEWIQRPEARVVREAPARVRGDGDARVL